MIQVLVLFLLLPYLANVFGTSVFPFTTCRWQSLHLTVANFESLMERDHILCVQRSNTEKQKGITAKGLLDYFGCFVE